MKEATIPVYVRFGDVPTSGHSKIFASGDKIGEEVGVSVYRAVEANGMYFPELPEDSNENGIADYFRLLLHSDKRVYLVTGTEMRYEGQGREPLLSDVTVLSEITHYYRKEKPPEDESNA